MHNDSTLRVGLLTTLGSNIGDDFIRDGLVLAIQLAAPDRPLICEAVNKHEPHTVYPPWHPIRLGYADGFRARRNTGPIRRMAERWLPPFGLSRFDSCDVVLQCGTPVIWEDCRRSEWARLIWRDVLARLARSGTPILNLGGGACYPWERRPTTLIGNPDEEFIRVMLSAARVTTARDRLAQALFASLGHETQTLCCPAMLAAQSHSQPTAPTRKVLINFMRGGGHYDWGQGIDNAAWEATMRHVVSHLARQHWEPLFVAHNAEELRLAAEVCPDVPRVCPESVKGYCDVVRDAAFGVFNRMHASVAVAGLGIPSIAIGTDTRNLMVENLGLPVFYVKDATTEHILSAIHDVASSRDRVARRLLELRDSTEAAYVKCLRPFVGASPTA